MHNFDYILYVMLYTYIQTDIHAFSYIERLMNNFLNEPYKSKLQTPILFISKFIMLFVKNNIII